jgi:hypothetical protein
VGADPLRALETQSGVCALQHCIAAPTDCRKPAGLHTRTSSRWGEEDKPLATLHHLPERRPGLSEGLLVQQLRQTQVPDRRCQLSLEGTAGISCEKLPDYSHYLARVRDEKLPHLAQPDAESCATRRALSVAESGPSGTKSSISPRMPSSSARCMLRMLFDSANPSSVLDMAL